MNAAVEFHRYMDMPHRRPAYGVNSPAVFRHLVFRIDDPARAASENPLRAESYSDARSARNSFINDLNRRLITLQTCCHANQIFAFSPTNAPVQRPALALTRNAPVSTSQASGAVANAQAVSYVDINRTLLTELLPSPAEGQHRGWRIRLLVDVHSEYYALTFILDQPRDLPRESAVGDARTAIQIEEHLSRRPQTDGKSEPDQAASGGFNSGDAIKFLYDDVWTRVTPQICAGTTDADDETLGMPGIRIAEFRSFALRDLESDFAKKNAANGQGEKTDSIFLTGDPQIDRTFSQSRYRLRQWVMNNGAFVRDVLKLNQLTQTLDRDANCVLCEVLDGGAIYGSSLGQMPSAGRITADKLSALKQPAHLRYFIVYNDLSKYQLGRLIRRHHVLGELRIAALIDHDQIVRAGAEIRALGNEIDRLLMRQAGSSSATNLSPEDLGRVQYKLHAVHSGIKPGGLSYRVGRSRYYADIFEKRVKEMRIHRLEGFEPYDVFIARTLNQIFNFISSVGTRYQTLADRILRLATSHNVERMTKMTEEINDVQREVLEIQNIGEAIGIGAFAYYVGNILFIVAKAGAKGLCWLNGTTPQACEAAFHNVAEIVELGCMFSAFCVALFLLPAMWERWKWFWTRKRLAAIDKRARARS